MTEQELRDWDELAKMLGFRDLVHREFFRNEGDAAAMLHGLACLEANGYVRETTSHPSRNWVWVGLSEAGAEENHARALVALLASHRHFTNGL
jgi:hypothetical protein